MRPVFKELDLEKSGKLDVDIFLKIAHDHNICLSDDDKRYLKNKIAFHSKVIYEDVIKDLVLVIQSENSTENRSGKNHSNQISIQNQESGSQEQFNKYFKWILRSNNHQQVEDIKNTEAASTYLRLFRIKNNKQLIMNQIGNKTTTNFNNQNQNRFGLSFQQKRSKDDENAILNIFQEHREDYVQDSNIQKDSKSQTQTTLGESINENQYIKGYSQDLKDVIQKITGDSKVKNVSKTYDWSKQISAISKKINILKNVQNRMFIKNAQGTEQVQTKKEKIRKYMKENNVDIMHLNAIESVFLDCDEERQGQITKKELILKIAELNLQFPADFLFKLIEDMQENDNDKSEQALLKYDNLKNIIEIYNNCPIFLKGDSNNSDNFKRNMDTNKELLDDQARIDKLFRYVHMRIEEKFKDFRHAFRSFDKNFDGGLNFKEFITGMEGIGVKLKISDYRLIFDALDYDLEGEIGFFKFCLLNTDRKHDLQKLKKEHEDKIREKALEKGINSAKPPRPAGGLTTLSVSGVSQSDKSNKHHPLFGDGNIPKNKDLSNFTKDIQDVTPIQQYMQKRYKRLSTKSNSVLSDSKAFGMTYKRDHNIVALLTNSYSENASHFSMEDLRSQASKKQFMNKNTNAQLVRNEAIKLKLSNLPPKRGTPGLLTPVAGGGHSRSFMGIKNSGSLIQTPTNLDRNLNQKHSSNLKRRFLLLGTSGNQPIDKVRQTSIQELKTFQALQAEIKEKNHLNRSLSHTHSKA